MSSHDARSLPASSDHVEDPHQPMPTTELDFPTTSESDVVRREDEVELPIGSDGEVDWDAYYDDPKLWEKVNADIAARRAGEVPVIRRMSANGSVVSAMMLGIRDALEMGKPKQEIVVQRDDSGDPDRPDKGFHLDFDPEDPTNTRATVRPWAGPPTEPASE
jgi:hypothetical protein